MNLPSWVGTLLEASKSERIHMRATVLRAVAYFKAQWERKPDGGYDLVAKNLGASKLSKELMDEKDWRAVGYIPRLEYVKIEGSKDQLGVLWDHKFGHPTLLYSHKSLPVILIAGPNIMFNDSIIRKIPANEYTEEVGGFTS